MSQQFHTLATDDPTDRPDSSRPSRRALLAATAIGLPAASVALTAAPAVADPSATDGSTAVVDLPLSEAPLVEVDGAPARELSGQSATLVGLTWPAESDAPVVEVRGQGEGGSWTEWCVLEIAVDPETGDQAPGTEPAWLGVVSTVQIRAKVDGGDATEGTTAHLIMTSVAPKDEETSRLSGPDATTTQDEQMTTMAATAAANPVTPRLGPGMPAFVTRAAWGADESVVTGTSGADRLKGVIIHHTAGTNSYTASQSPQILRGILTYHTGTMGWADVGYNILVDKYGQIFEGRSGGLHRNIIGAHALGFNTGSFGISVMGTYTSRTVSSAARAAVGRLVAWKLLTTFQTQVSAKSSWTSSTSGTRFPPGTTVSLPKMMGHRDVNYTECPGDSLYGQFSTIRNEAQSALDKGWKVHLLAFQSAGAMEKLGTVVRSNHLTGAYYATILTTGLVLQEGTTGKATGYASPMAPWWKAAWGRPTGSAFVSEGSTLQTFENGAALKKGSTVTFHDSRFIDVPPGMMFREEIEELAERGITTGWPDGTYRPLAEIQRDAMVAFVYRALGSPAFTPPSTSPFTDMSPSRMYYKEITWAHDQGIVNGWSDGTFRPTASIERGAVAAFLYRASGRPSSGTSNPFSDVPSTHQFAREITWLAATGITTGWPDGTFRPLAPIARDAMAAFMIRWMENRGL